MPLADIKAVPFIANIIGLNIPFVGRVAGIWGHQNFFGLMAMITLLYGIRDKKIIISMSGIIGLLVSFSRWPIFVTIIGLMYLSLDKNYKFLKKYSVSILIAIVLTGSFFYNTISSIYDNVYKDYNLTPKIYGMVKTIDLIQKYPFGVGIGMYGTKYSAGSKVYKELNFKKNIQEILLTATSGIESFYAILISQTGIIGLIFFIMIFLRYLVGSTQIDEKLKYILILIIPIYYNLYFPSFLVYSLILFKK